MAWAELLKFILLLLLSALVLTPFIVGGANCIIDKWWNYKLTFWKTMTEILVSQKKHEA